MNFYTGSYCTRILFFKELNLVTVYHAEPRSDKGILVEVKRLATDPANAT